MHTVRFVNWSLLATALMLLLGSTGTLAFSPSVPHEYDPHDPILIEGDPRPVVGTDALAGNGIRKGSGTAHDPWVISNWIIRPDADEAGILLRDINGSVLIKDIRLIHTQSRGGVQPAIIAANSADVTFERITVTTPQVGFKIESSKAAVLDTDVWGENGCFRFIDSEAKLNNVSTTAPCSQEFDGPNAGISITRSSVAANQVQMVGPHRGVVIENNAEPVSLQDVTMTFKQEGGSPLGSGLTGIWVRALSDTGQVRVSNFSAVHPEAAWQNDRLTDCIRIDGQAEGNLAATDVELQGCQRGIWFNHASMHAAEVTGFTIHGAGEGIRCDGCEATVSEGRFQDNIVHGFAEGQGALLRVQDSWWDSSGRFDGNVQLGEKNESLAPESARKESPIPWLAPLVGVLLAVLFVRRP